MRPHKDDDDNNETYLEGVSLIQLTPEKASTETKIPLGTPIVGRAHRRSGSGSSQDLNGSGSLQDYTGSPSKTRANRPILARRGLVYAFAVAIVGSVWLGVNYVTTEKFEEQAIQALEEVAHSSHLWGKGTKPGSVKSISILGERNSGTTWLYE